MYWTDTEINVTVKLLLLYKIILQRFIQVRSNTRTSVLVESSKFATFISRTTHVRVLSLFQICTKIS